jgi:hypothetical protein
MLKLVHPNTEQHRRLIQQVVKLGDLPVVVDLEQVLGQLTGTDRQKERL